MVIDDEADLTEKFDDLFQVDLRVAIVVAIVIAIASCGTAAV